MSPTSRGVIKGAKKVTKKVTGIPSAAKQKLKNIFKSKLDNDFFNPQSDYRAAQRYTPSITIDLTELKSSNSFDNYVTERKTSLETFTGLKNDQGEETPFKTPKGDIVSEQLNKAVDAEAVKATQLKNAFSDAMKLSDETDLIKQNYNADIQAVNRLLKTKPHPNAVAGYLGDVRAQVKSALEAQHTQEKNAITALFEEDSFKSNLTSIGVTPDNLEAFKTETLSVLENAQNEEKEKLDKSIKADIDKLHMIYSSEIRRIAYLHHLAQTKKGREAINEALLAQPDEERPEGAPEEPAVDSATNDFDAENGIAKLSGLKLKDLKKFRPLSNDITVAEDGSFVMKLSSWNKWNIGDKNIADLNKANLAELTALAKAVRASGCNRIDTNINFALDRNRALAIGQQAYEAAIEAGFSDKSYNNPKNKDDKDAKPDYFINIKVNGESMTAEKLFENDLPRLERLKKRAEELRADRKDISAFYSNRQKELTNNFRKQVQEDRLKYERSKPPGADDLSPKPGPSI